MSDQRKRVNSLIRSSISINSIRNSATDFSKGLTRSNVIATEIVDKTRKNNLFKSNLIRKESEYFRKRRENVRRKDREDELEAASITGVTKKEGNIIQRSTRGFLGRILDFFGIVLIGWFINTLPKILKAIGALITRIQKFVALLTGFIDNLKEFFTGITEGISAAFDALPTFDFGNFKSEAEKIFNNTTQVLQSLYQSFFLAARQFNDPEKLGMTGDDINDQGVLDYGEDVESEMEAAYAEMEGLEGAEEGENVNEEDVDRLISSLDEENVNEEGQNQEQIDDKGVTEEELIKGLEDGKSSAEKVVKSEKDFKDGKSAATKKDANNLKTAMNFLNPGGLASSGGAGGEGGTGLPEERDKNYQQKLDAALIRKENYEETGDFKKLQGVEEKIEFYEKVIAKQNEETDPNNYVTVKRNKKTDLKTDKNQNAPTIIITEGKTKNMRKNIPVANFASTLVIPESDNSDASINKIQSLILST